MLAGVEDKHAIELRDGGNEEGAKLVFKEFPVFFRQKKDFLEVGGFENFAEVANIYLCPLLCYMWVLLRA